MLPDTICTGPFWTIASIRLGGSGWITALIAPPIFGSCATAEAVMPQARRTPSNTRFDMSYLSQARPAVNASQRPRARSDGWLIPIPHPASRLTWSRSAPQDESLDSVRTKNVQRVLFCLSMQRDSRKQPQRRADQRYGVLIAPHPARTREGSY